MNSSPKEIAFRWFNEVWNERRTELIPQLLAPEAKGHLEGGVDIVGPAAFIEFQQSILAALPDIRVEIVNSLADENDACILWKATANHSGYGMGFAPTGKPVSFRGTTWFHIEDGMITEGWDCWNQDQLLTTLAGVAEEGTVA